MILRCWFCFALFIPAFCQAQHWRVQASGGIAAPDVFGTDQRILTHGPYLTNAPFFINTENDAVLKSIGGLKLMRHDSAFEYGIGVQALTIKCSETRREP